MSLKKKKKTCKLWSQQIMTVYGMILKYSLCAPVSTACILNNKKIDNLQNSGVVLSFWNFVAYRVSN